MTPTARIPALPVRSVRSFVTPEPEHDQAPVDP